MGKIFGKVLVTIFTILSVLSASLLWITRDVTLKSQSMYHDQSNVVWYILMHTGIIMSFFILNSLYKRWTYGIVAFASILTLIFDVYLSSFMHNIFTTILFLTAVYSLIIHSNYRSINLYWKLGGIASIAFLSGLIGLLGPSGIFLGEYIAEVCLSIGILHQIWLRN